MSAAVLSTLGSQSCIFFARATLCSLLLPAIASAQRTAINTNFNAWFMYFGDHSIANTRWGIHLEGQLRRNEGINTWQQWLLRSGVNFQLNNHILITTGLAYVKSYPYGNLVALSSRENRFYEQVVLKNNLNRLSIQNRLRLEQRLIENVSDIKGGVKVWD